MLAYLGTGHYLAGGGGGGGGWRGGGRAANFGGRVTIFLSQIWGGQKSVNFQEPHSERFLFF